MNAGRDVFSANVSYLRGEKEKDFNFAGFIQGMIVRQSQTQ